MVPLGPPFEAPDYRRCDLIEALMGTMMHHWGYENINLNTDKIFVFNQRLSVFVSGHDAIWSPRFGNPTIRSSLHANRCVPAYPGGGDRWEAESPLGHASAGRKTRRLLLVPCCYQVSDFKAEYL